MPIHLVIPGLLWPRASLTGPASDLELPALARLLGTGQRRTADFEPLDRQLARLLGHRAAHDRSPPLAALRRLGEDDPPVDAGSGEWLCADPVNVSFAREHLLLNDFPPGELAGDEVAALVEALNAAFPDLGRFEACSDRRWYLRVAEPPRATLFPLHDVVGRPVQHFLPEGDDARLWRRTMNEVQVLLHNHPVNQAREAAGRRTANSVWFWGAGSLAAPAAPLPLAVQSSDPLTRGFVRAAGAEPKRPDFDAAVREPTLVVLDDLLEASRHLDLDRWRDHLVALERDWFAPLLDALGNGRVDSVRLTAPGDRQTLELEVRRSDRWKLWRKPLPFDALLKSLTPPAPSLPDEPGEATRPDR